MTPSRRLHPPIARRTFLAGTSAVLLAAPLTAEGQQPSQKMPLVGLLDFSASDPGRLETARTRGLTLPPALIARADQVIE